ncbi:serine/threonine-protein kinase [Tundrisphaera lichenicola]|uniref:serine/threonine-protein kinase n=1 Tax=Tundrisphaera lichenicola TaxID=2029860 RepID=UPI003EC1514C
MSDSDGASSSTDTPLVWAGYGPAPRARDLTGVELGDFQVDRLLGRGGMGEVYLARQKSLNRQVALKVLRPDLLGNSTYLRRFEAEASSAAKLNHPNIVHIYTLGEADGLRFIAMEYVQGTNLREYIERKGSPDLPQALSIMKQAAVAVGAAGDVGLIHRDIKPENLLLTRKGQVKVADFGLCRDLADRDHQMTQPGVTLGTPLYMSPEQALGHSMDHRSDLYSLGVTYYHMLAGHPPFRAQTALALAMKHVSDTPVNLSVYRPDLPADLIRLVMKLMAKSPAERYQSASEMLRDLARIREAVSAPSMAGVPITTGTSADSSPEKSTAKFAVDREKSPGGPWKWDPRALVGLGAIGLIVGGLAGWLAHPADLLGKDPGGRSVPPALWISPDWTQVEVKPTAADQYRHAQLVADPDDRESAWVAVSGHHPQDSEWVARSYTQLAGDLFRRRDRGRLHSFAKALETSTTGRDEILARMMLVGVDEIDGDAEKVIGFFDDNSFNVVNNLLDPGVADFGLTIALALQDDAKKLGLSPSARAKLKAVVARLLRKSIEIKRLEIQG